MLDFGRNWLEHAVRGPAAIRNAVAGCADAAAGALATEYGVPCVDLGPYLADTKAAAAHEHAGGSHAGCQSTCIIVPVFACKLRRYAGPIWCLVLCFAVNRYVDKQADVPSNLDVPGLRSRAGL